MDGYTAQYDSHMEQFKNAEPCEVKDCYCIGADCPDYYKCFPNSRKDDYGQETIDTNIRRDKK